MKKIILVIALMLIVILASGCSQKTNFSSNVVYIPQTFIEETVLHETFIVEQTYENSTISWD